MTGFILFLLVLGVLLTPALATANTAPVVSNVQAAQRLNSFLVDITYDLFDAEGHQAFVSIYFSPDGGQTWPIRCTDLTGPGSDFPFPGTGLTTTWNAETDYPDLISSTCTVRVVAVDHAPWPRMESFWKSDLDGQNETAFTSGDTIAFGEPFRLRWQGVAPVAQDLDPLMVADLDSVFPHDDGLLGYKYEILGQGCVPTLDDCWQPRRFDEATYDSVSYFADVTFLDFLNDGSGTDPFAELLPSGTLDLKFNALDVAGLEIREPQQEFQVVVNFDPETIVLDGETDWAHPGDPEIYPYYILLNDPTQEHHPFRSGDRIPDRTYVVVKALGRDDPRDALVDPGYGVGISGYVRGTRQNLGGGLFSFQSESSLLSHPPTWGPDADGWSADTLGFLTGPRTEFIFHMQAVDEHGRKDGTPATLSFEVGYPPCLQCIEILPKSGLPSAYDETLVCLADTSRAAMEAHPCFGDTAVLRVTETGTGPGELEYNRNAYMLIDKETGLTEVVDDPNQGGEDNFELPAKIFRMYFLLHGLDDARERWDEPVRRLMGCSYQVDYDCDPANLIQDGPGNDDLGTPTWGISSGQNGLDIDPATGLWRLAVEIAVPGDLIALGPDNFRDVILQYILGISDPVLRQRVFEDATRQLGAGQIQAIALDQTQCQFLPVRPARYNFFRGVRPTVATLPMGMSWRDCYLQDSGFVPGIMLALDLSQGAMASLDGEPAARHFRIIVETADGDFECQGP